jgi:hypothetical protein
VECANGVPAASCPDSDGDGVPNHLDSDSDADSVPDRIDLDSDNDGLSDLAEQGNGAQDHNGDGMVDGSDTDGDGVKDSVDGAPNGYGDAPFTPEQSSGYYLPLILRQ